VTSKHLLHCGQCQQCLQGHFNLCGNTRALGVHEEGAFAEYVKVPFTNIYRPEKIVKPSHLAIFIPFSNAVKACSTYEILGEDVLISGAGHVGMISAMVTRLMGAQRVCVIDINNASLDKARELGVDMAKNSSRELDWKKIRSDLGMNDGFGIGLYVSSWQKPFDDLINAMKPNGKCVLLGLNQDKLSVDTNQIIYKMLTLQGLFGSQNFAVWRQCENMIGMGVDLDKVITHELH